MCTLSVVPLAPSVVRLAFNRDESRTRPAGLPPRVQRFGPRTAALPTDPTSGGTWLAVNDAGLALAVLNVNLVPSSPSPRWGEGSERSERVRGATALPAPSDPSPDRRSAGHPLPSGERVQTFTRSRGTVIPALLECDSPSAALAACERLAYRDFAPFRLVLVGQGVVADVRWDGREPMVMSRLVSGPQMFTSSGLGDHLVEDVRRELFDELFAGASDTWPTAQYTFHRHTWPDREHLSVNMSRATARTVSHAVIDFGPANVTFTYHADAPDRPAEDTTIRLSLINGVA